MDTRHFGVILATAAIWCLRIPAGVRIRFRPFTDFAGAMSPEMTLDPIHWEDFFSETDPELTRHRSSRGLQFRA
jgi:hypothetical protein